ncbi:MULTISPECIES: 16S rRNA (adenine(1518)-N(6)/adenine(1519)-N(6))-dimethyltransferase RsmA [Dietzia]|uniref:16S rRNA (adenine(1518)-N(6)/adenine(1519)-N(6))- dimethyltransferase RsmA n=1 Tax=Dietzia TaxID=37914 RepID=UPI000782CB35|nr:MULTISPECIES: 16S rRNA (adenine(1518)-N(6)/adenine(1519)-N(6))-dimethyltransferase RsmA [Dietzia]KZO60082.1 16S rRNA (adenine(1518)-N(6)/adenine(1519)-N(6))-dimethyltransferase [Dietzia maris]MCT1884416.1 16S rRNA (adenine(1518)-N(6)/adenine(1519)-N(6))-dimethyltransferase RsmA [Dietzia cinnamea]MCT2058434.1 16S rRNA (adenine(1518)-N(6)/adenine(1519)-N(6))-dimethyltransferase RsmA [Dietzia cinnamea]MCT2061152.1 16S rRNA (adenine(1518)-N(6)/adenine(1519)-N(6))-dimethyltransferase RsmA [Dietzi
MTGPDATFRGEAEPLGPQEVRALAAELGVTPTKTLGQNFVHDANTVRKIVTASGVGRDDTVIEVGPGLGSLTLPLLDAAGRVVAVEIDPVLAARLPRTVAERAPRLAELLTVVGADALAVSAADLGEPSPTALVANLPYNVSVPVLLHLLAEVPTLRTALVMVQLEVADRLAAAPGSRVYGVPSVKAGFFGTVRRTGVVGRNVFWPVPNVESGLVRIDAYPEAPWDLGAEHRRRVFAVVDAAFAQRRKTLRAALSGWAGSGADAELALTEAGVDPRARGEQLTTADFVRVAAAAARLGIGPGHREP